MRSIDETRRADARGEHNGWTNYSTWAAHLWLSNDEPLYREACSQARRCDVAAWSVWAREALSEFATAFYADDAAQGEDVPEYPDDIDVSAVDWSSVFAAFAPDETPCKHCGDDTGDEDESYCGADCAVDHAAELRGEVEQLRATLDTIGERLLSAYETAMMEAPAFVDGEPPATQDIDTSGGEAVGYALGLAEVLRMVCEVCEVWV